MPSTTMKRKTTAEWREHFFIDSHEEYRHRLRPIADPIPLVYVLTSDRKKILDSHILEACLKNFIEDKETKRTLIMDLGNVEALGVDAIRVLQNADKSLRQKGEKLMLAAVSPEIREGVELAAPYHRLNIAENVREALRLCQQGAGAQR